jgi:hypothetical protein
MINGNDFIIKYFGIAFIAAGIVRYYSPIYRKKELNDMGLLNGFDYLIILFEIFIGIFLLFDLYDKTVILIIFLLFLILGTVLIIINNYKRIINEFNEVFLYQPTAMSLVFHCAYIIMVIGVLLNLNYKNK